MKIWLWVACAAMAVAGQTNAARAATVCTLLADAATGGKLVSEGDCDRRVTPASTFKIAIALMGYDAGILKDEHTPKLPFKKGYPSWVPAWKADQDPTSWIANSVVWYSQQVTRRLSAEKFDRYIRAFAYGNRDGSGDPGKGNGLTRAWLSSSLKISPAEQVEFLRALTTGKLPVSRHALDMTAAITSVGSLPGGWDLHGKTGTGPFRKIDGALDQDHAYGWFVGWAVRDGRTVVFARLVEEKGRRVTMTAGRATRDAMIAELPALLPAR
ncbi:MAG: class D beta-lactamase [Mesorhizobium sp.]|nr:class D beta-lactamase [Mesorhizobium sp.]MBN9244497.1 class D beta-lactamase [Mesorhizobium sp.]